MYFQYILSVPSLFILTTAQDGLLCGYSIPHGNVPWWCSGIRCPYSCEQGYDQHEEVPFVSCSASGSWFPDPWRSTVSIDDICIPKPCPNQIPNGQLTDTCLGTVGSTCEYTCNEGYQKKPVLTITCLPTTNWSVDPHTLCTNEDQCPYAVEHGDLKLSCKRHFGDVCSYTCHEGYMPSPTSRNITCSSPSTWDKPLSSLCQKLECSRDVPNGKVLSTCSRTYGSRCYDYTCDYGYTKLPYSPPLECNESGQWEWSSHGENLCTRDEDLCPSDIKNGRIVRHCTRQHGAFCTFSCNSGCDKELSVGWLTCRNDNKWDKDTDSLCTNCRVTTTAIYGCSSTIIHGKIVSGCSLLPYSVCSLKCDFGCEQILRTLTCSKSGRWISESSACNCQGSVSSPDFSSSGTTAGAVIGGLIGGLILLISVTAAACVYRRKMINRASNSGMQANQPVTYHGMAISAGANNGRANGITSPVYSVSTTDTHPPDYYASLHPQSSHYQSPYTSLQLSTVEVNIQGPSCV